MLEVNYDGLVGPTHNYAGLSHGNVASQSHGGEVSKPRLAALQGLSKMRHLLHLGARQGVLPPQERPALDVLRGLGFSGNDTHVLERAGRSAPGLLASCYSASGMWAANAATVSPSADSDDDRVHFTPANLISTFHRSLEPDQTSRTLQRLFADPACFRHHPPLPAHAAFGDEGAANHTRLWTQEDAAGTQLFVYGRDASQATTPGRYPARQSLAASEAITRLHRLDPARIVMAQQSPAAIDAGVFHNDVIAVGHGNLFFHHERAYLQTDVIASLRQSLGSELVSWAVPEARVSLERAVESYLFNSQLVHIDGTLQLIAPEECRADSIVHAYLGELVDGPAPVTQVHYLDVRESMKNGGGPACLRLRVPLTDAEWQRAHAPAQLDDAKLDALEAWVKRHYRESLATADLLDPALVEESRTALDELTGLLQLGSDFYAFQRA